MILTAHQPVYLPWLGLFHKIALADCFCIFDIAQYQKRDFNNRNSIKTADGPMLLTVPVNGKGRFGDQIKNTKIANDQWKSQHFKALYFNYKKAPFFNNYIDELEAIYFGREYSYLSDLNTTMLKFFLEKLDITTKIIRASDYSFIGKKSNLVLNMCQNLQAETIIFGQNGKNYVDAEKFLQKAVELMPLDPIINDHYGDVLWMLNKDIQARYIWASVLKMEDTEQELKDIIEKKLIFGIKRQL